MDVQGTVADGFEPVRDAFASNFVERGELGAAVTVYRDGHKVVDLWGGSTDPAGERDHGREPAPWAEDTAVLVRSATKGVAAAVPHLLHQRGQLDLDAPVSSYWPEFKAQGKERLLVRHLLAHRAGLPVLDRPLTPEQAIDGVSGPAALAAQRPLWEPGQAHGYHPHTYGWLLGELVRRATGRTLRDWFATEVARPLGLDLWLGFPDEAAYQRVAPRIARVGPVPTPEQRPAQGLKVRAKPAVVEAYRDPESLTRRAFGAIDPLPDDNDPHYHRAGLSSSAGITTARSLAAFYAALIGPPPDGGRRLFTPATLTQARSLESQGPDRVLVVNTRFGLGYMLHAPGSPMWGPGSFGHPGRGGSLGFADPESGLALSYVTAALQKSVTSDPRAQAVLAALRRVLRD
ncbi:serine hydrolase domain-containing protein [Streptomyces sp. NPDC005438]|uniref:serine hydrolase domain-containing protein n=1 Tax=Streptomyces sp. NPDC005438 TaxID=3156880 RepID=UPI0033BC8AA6